MYDDLEFKRLLATQCIEGIAAMKAEKIIMKRPLIDLSQIETDPEVIREVLGDYREVEE